jgi:hypothetical protein
MAASGHSQQPSSLSLLLESVCFASDQPSSFTMETEESTTQTSNGCGFEQNHNISVQHDDLQPTISVTESGDGGSSRLIKAEPMESRSERHSHSRHGTDRLNLEIPTTGQEKPFSTGNTPPSMEEPFPNSELGADAVMRELAARLETHDQQGPDDVRPSIESDVMMAGLKPESYDPFLFDNIATGSGSDNTSSLGLTTANLPMAAIDSPFQPSLPSAGIFSQDYENSPFGMATEHAWNVDDFIGTPMSLLPTDMESLKPAGAPAQHPYIRQMLDENGRRRSQSMPPPSAFTFRRHLPDGRVVDIGKPTEAPMPPHLAHLDHSASAPPSAHKLRHHPYERNVDRGRRAPNPMKAGPRSYPVSPRSRPVTTMRSCSPGSMADRMGLGEYHRSSSGHGHYRSSSTMVDREDKRKGGRISKKNQGALTTARRDEVDAFAMPIMMQFDAVKSLLICGIDELKAGPPDEIEV